MTKGICVFVAFFLALTVQAADKHADCSKEESLEVDFFASLAGKAEIVKRAECDPKETKNIREAFEGFLREAESSFQAYGGFKNGENPITYVRQEAALVEPYPQVIFSTPDEQAPIPAFLLQIRGGEKYIEVSNHVQCTEKAVDIGGDNKNCTDVFIEFADIYNFAQKFAEHERRLATLKKIKGLRKQWEPFLDHMKGQTPIELALNGWIFRKKKHPDAFIPPPETQLIFLHPSVLVENVSDAIDGEDTKEALAIEAIGINWWGRKKWYQPSGTSLIAVYADRQNVKDWGYGLAVHFGGKYTIGYADHDGDPGVFVSFDLVKLFQNNENAKKAYNIVFNR